MKIKDITDYIESLAPLSTQEDYDNCGLIVGDREEKVSGVLVTLDCIESVVDEAIAKNCNLILAHHPIVFKGLKKLTGEDYVQRTILKAIKNGIAIYAAHTNFDHFFYGVNYEIAKRIGLNDLKILAPKSGILNKLVFYVPTEERATVLEALFSAGAGEIGNYSECSFRSIGLGTYKPSEAANPYEGQFGIRSEVEEERVEVLVDQYKSYQIIQALKNVHPYEEVAFELYAIENQNQMVGAGMIGELDESQELETFLAHLKKTFNCDSIRYTSSIGKQIKRVAICGGSGSFLLKRAIQSQADIFITGDFKYHEFFDADNQIVIADIGHFESEQYTSHRFADILKKKFPKFAVHLTEVETNPIKYF